MKSYKNLLNLEFRRNYKQIINIILLVLLFTVIINSIIFLFENEKIKLNTTIGLVVEDKASQVSLLLGSIQNEELKEIITFKETNLKEGKELLKKDELVSLIYIKKGTFKDLDSGKSANLVMYVKNERDLRVKFLSNYIRNMVDMLNSSQNSAMIYYDILKENGESYNNRISELNRLSMKYIKNFLFRSQIFKSDKIINKFLGLTAFDYYYNVLLVLLIILASIIYHNVLEEDIKRGRIDRLINSGYTLKSICISKIIISLFYVGILIFPLKISFLYLFSEISLKVLIVFLIKYIVFTIIIQSIIIYFYFKIKKDLIRDIFFIIFFLLIGLSGGLIIPIDSLPKLFIELKEINLLYIGFKSFIGRELVIYNIFALLVYFLAIIGLIRKEVYFD